MSSTAPEPQQMLRPSDIAGAAARPRPRSYSGMSRVSSTASKANVGSAPSTSATSPASTGLRRRPSVPLLRLTGATHSPLARQVHENHMMMVSSTGSSPVSRPSSRQGAPLSPRSSRSRASSVSTRTQLSIKQSLLHFSKRFSCFSRTGRGGDYLGAAGAEFDELSQFSSATMHTGQTKSDEDSDGSDGDGSITVAMLPPSQLVGGGVLSRGAAVSGASAMASGSAAAAAAAAASRAAAHADEPRDPDLDEHEPRVDPRPPASELTTEHVQMHKLCKMMTDEAGAIVALSSIAQMDLDAGDTLVLVRDVDGLEPIIKLCFSPNAKIKERAAFLLGKLLRNDQNKVAARQADAAVALTALLAESTGKTSEFASVAIAEFAKNGRNRIALWRAECVRALGKALRAEPGKDAVLAHVRALAALTRNVRAQADMLAQSGVALLMGMAGANPSEELMTQLLHVLRNVAQHERHVASFAKHKVYDLLVKQMSAKVVDADAHIANALAACMDDAGQGVPAKLVADDTALPRMMELFRSPGSQVDVLIGVLSAVGRAAEQSGAVDAMLCKRETAPMLVPLLSHSDLGVQARAAHVIVHLARTPDGRKAVRAASGLGPLVSLLTSTNAQVLRNVCEALYYCALMKENRKTITDNDGVRLLWSLLKNPSPAVKAQAARALAPCMEDPEVAGNVRMLVGGLALLVSLLDSDDDLIQAYASSTIAVLAADDQNLAVITEYSVVPKLARLVKTTIATVQQHLAQAYAQVARVPANSRSLGDLGVVRPLVQFLRTPNDEVQRATCIALAKLSADAANSAEMREAGAVPLLVGLMSSDDTALQEAAAVAIANTRRFHIATREQQARSARSTPRSTPRSLDAQSPPPSTAGPAGERAGVPPLPLGSLRSRAGTQPQPPSRSAAASSATVRAPVAPGAGRPARAPAAAARPPAAARAAAAH